MSRDEGVRDAMTGCLRVRGLIMLNVKRVCGVVVDDGVLGSVGCDVGVDLCLRAHRAVVMLPLSSVCAKSQEPFGSGLATHTVPSSNTISASSEWRKGL